MTPPVTEALHAAASGLDARPIEEIAALLIDAQVAASTVTQHALAGLAGGATAMATSVRSGGVLHYTAAGSSGLMAASDAMELGGTFSIPPSQVRIHMAGGLPTGAEMPGDTEDETRHLEAALAGISARDTVIAVSASGHTPYTLAAVRIARAQKATVIAIANNRDAALFDGADHAVCLETPPELVAGSTRMGAGTAQKIALNTLSTLMAVELGHIHDGMMVNLRADNAKLRGRAVEIVCRVAAVEKPAATAALKSADGEVKPAILTAKAGVAPDEARAILQKHGGKLRSALMQLKQRSSTKGELP